MSQNSEQSTNQTQSHFKEKSFCHKKIPPYRTQAKILSILNIHDKTKQQPKT
jgi:hypothetical protein